MALLKSVRKRLSSTQSNVKKQWQRYSKIRSRVNSRKDLSKTEKKQILASELDLTRQKISAKYRSYREYKNDKLYNSPYEGFKYAGQITKTSWINPKTGKPNKLRYPQKIYKARKNFDTDKLDNTVNKILQSDPNIKGVLVVFEVIDVESGNTHFVSNFINAMVMERIRQNNSTVFEYVAERLRAGSTKDNKLKFIYMRLVYENSKTGDNRK